MIQTGTHSPQRAEQIINAPCPDGVLFIPKDFTTSRNLISAVFSRPEVKAVWCQLHSAVDSIELQASLRWGWEFSAARPLPHDLQEFVLCLSRYRWEMHPANRK